VSLSVGSVYTISCFVKSTSGSNTNFRLFGCNLITSSNQTANNEWQKFSFTFTADSNTSHGISRDSSNNNADLLVWGMQLEASTYPTSYIPTTSASATRVADACLTASVPSLIGQSEGVLFIDFNKTASLASSLFILSNIAGTTVNSYKNSIYIFIIADSALAVDGYINDVSQFNFALGAISVGRHKIALAYKANDFALYIDGVLVGTDTSGSVPAMNYLTIGGGADVGNQSQSVNQAALFKTRLTNAELASLTTI
jgi:hypothetical protein